jgi:hypothetical protein
LAAEPAPDTLISCLSENTCLPTAAYPGQPSSFGGFPGLPLSFVLTPSAYAYQRRISLVLASEDAIAAERAVAKTTNVVAFTRKRPARQPFSEHLPRERVIEPRPTVCRAAAARGCASWARTSPRRWS